MNQWQCLLELNTNRERIGGSESTLVDAIRRGADLRIATEFRHNEHIDTASASAELIREVAEFGVTYLLDDRWCAALMSLRQPVSLPDRFGPRPSMSFFLYNQNGLQAVARPFFDGDPAESTFGPSEPAVEPNMPRYHAHNAWDGATNAPSQNFIYDFDHYRYCVRDDWREVLAHDAAGAVRSGSIDALDEAFSAGAEVKVAVSNLCDDLVNDGTPLVHEVIVQAGSCYYYTEQKLFLCGTHPIIRVRPAIPMQYASRNWDFGWLVTRSDGHVVYRRCDPYTLAFTDHTLRCGIRWFVR